MLQAALIKRFNVVLLQKTKTMLEISFTQQGQQYISNPIFASGNSVIAYQIGYEKAGARLLLDKSFSPTDGWRLFLDQVAPAMDFMCVGSQPVPKSMYIRFRSDSEPIKVLVDLNVSGDDGSAEEPSKNPTESEIVDTLPETGKEGGFYFVKNNSENENNQYDEYMFVNGKYEKIGEPEHELADENDINQLFG